MKSVVALLLLAAAVGLSSADDVNVVANHPIEKVIAMLGGLKTKVEFEAKREVLLYEKYQKWCADSTKTLSKAIQDEEETISMLESEQSAKSKEAATLEQEISELAQALADLEAAGGRADDNRAQANKVYQQASQDLQSTIVAFESAITELIAAKGGSAASMMQVMNSPRVQEALALAEASAVDDQQREVLVALQADPANYTNKPRPSLKAAGDYEDHIQKYRFKSDNVIELLKGLKAKFEDDLLTATKEETNSVNAYNLAKQARDGEKAAATTAKTGKSSTLSSVKTDLAQVEIDLKEEKDDHAADTASLKSTTESCQVKTREWEERSRVRDQEKQAMDVAAEILGKASGVRTEAPSNPRAPTSPIAAANPSPEGLSATGGSFLSEETSATEGRRTPIFAHQNAEALGNSDAALRWDEQLSRQGSLSFLQVSEDPRQRAIQLLRKAATATHSHALERLAQELSLRPNSAFDQVINSIQKMVYHLEDEQRDEDKHKMWCDQELMKTNTSKSDKEDKIEELRLRIEKDKGTAQKLAMESKAAQAMLSKIADFVAEATEIRTVGKKENAEALKDAQQAQDAIAQATSVLETFYKESGMVKKQSWEFVQQPVELPAEPSTWGAGYTGVADPTNQPVGILTVLQKIGSEFAAMEADTRAQEQTDQQQFEDEMKRSAIEKQRRTEELELKSQEKKRLLGDIDQLSKSRKHLTNELEAVNQYLKDLEPACVTGDSSYEDRKASRTEEIQALKASEQILKDAFKEEQPQNQTGSGSFLGFR